MDNITCAGLDMHKATVRVSITDGRRDTDRVGKVRAQMARKQPERPDCAAFGHKTFRRISAIPRSGPSEDSPRSFRRYRPW